VTPFIPEPREPRKPNFRLMIAALPALIATSFAINAVIQMGHASRAVSGGDDTSKTGKSLQCVETYAITLANSEYYVREGTWSVAPRGTPEVSTVLNGMARNDCGEPLKKVTIDIKVRDDAGNRGNGSVVIDYLNPGEAKPFSKAWMGHVSSYEIATIQ
jgi:hypothetical protein